jgi:hypothetical protein
MWLYSIKKTKGGDDTTKTRTTYHGTLRQVCDTIIDRESGECESIVQLQEFLASASDMLADKVESLNS